MSREQEAKNLGNSVCGDPERGTQGMLVLAPPERRDGDECRGDSTLSKAQEKANVSKGGIVPGSGEACGDDALRLCLSRYCMRKTKQICMVGIISWGFPMRMIVAASYKWNDDHMNLAEDGLLFFRCILDMGVKSHSRTESVEQRDEREGARVSILGPWSLLRCRRQLAFGGDRWRRSMMAIVVRVALGVATLTASLGPMDE